MSILSINTKRAASDPIHFVVGQFGAVIWILHIADGFDNNQLGPFHT